MKLLDAVNISLRWSGKGSVNSLSTSDPSAAHAQSTIHRVRREILAHGYPFNTRKVDLAVNTAGRIPIAKSYLKVLLPRDLVIQSDQDTDALYIWNTNENDWHDKSIDNSEVVFDDDELTNLEDAFAQWIAWQSAVEFFSETHPGEDATASLRDKYVRAQTLALNGIQHTNFNNATGWTAISGYQNDWRWVMVNG